MTNDEIRRKTELVFKQELEAILGPEWKIFPARGNDPVPGQTRPPPPREPPFVQLETEEGEELDDDMWMVPLLIGYITAATDTIPSGHSEKVQALYRAIRGVPSPAQDGQRGYILHGFSVSTGDSFMDESRHARGDVFRVDVACSGFTPVP